jgi:hypothetical protein
VGPISKEANDFKMSSKRSRLVLSALNPTQEDQYRDALEVVGRLRGDRRLSLAAVSRDVGIDPRTVRRYAGSALEKRGHKYVARGYDRLPRKLKLFSEEEGYVEVFTRSSKAASTISRHNWALRRLAQAGDDSLLRSFEGKTITIEGKRYHFMTDRRRLNSLIRAGDLHVEEIYATGGL